MYLLEMWSVVVLPCALIKIGRFLGCGQWLFWRKGDGCALLRILFVPRLEWLQNLEAVGGRRDGNLNIGAVLWWGLVGVASGVVPSFGQTVASWLLQLELLAILVLESVSERVKS